MAPKKKKKDKQKPLKPKINLDAMMPKPKPIVMKGPRYSIQHAREYPFYGCWIMKGWQEAGITPVVIARQREPDQVIFGNFLVDIYCLGVKNAFAEGDFPLKRFQQNLDQMLQGEPEPCDVGFAHEIIYGAIDFARQYGFEPHPDFKLASQVLDPPEAHPPKHKLEFGKDGKPFFVAGPYDNARAIIAKLQRTAGEGNFNYVLALGGPEDF
jgi:hypothetical protein